MLTFQYHVTDHFLRHLWCQNKCSQLQKDVVVFIHLLRLHIGSWYWWYNVLLLWLPSLIYYLYIGPLQFRKQQWWPYMYSQITNIATQTQNQNSKYAIIFQSHQLTTDEWPICPIFNVKKFLYYNTILSCRTAYILAQLRDHNSATRNAAIHSLK